MWECIWRRGRQRPPGARWSGSSEVERRVGTCRLRLLILLPNLGGGGIERLTLNVIRSIDQERYEVTLLVHERDGPLVGIAEEFVTVRYIVNGPYSRWNTPRLLLETLREMNRSDICLAVNEGRAATLGLIAAKTLRVPIVGVVNFDWRTYISDRANSWRQGIGLQLYRYMTRVIAVSQGAADSLKRFTRVRAGNIHVISVPQIIADLEARSRHPIPDGLGVYFKKPTVVAVGRLSYQKGLDFLIQAHASLVARGVEHNLILVGDGELKGDLVSLAAELGVKDSVMFAGFQRNPLPFVTAATVFALPSRSEGQPLALAEALICGAAIVASDCFSGPREMLDGGTAGILIDVGDVDELANSIERVISDQDLRTRLKTNAKRRSLMFDHQTVGRQWQEVLEIAQSARP